MPPGEGFVGSKGFRPGSGTYSCTVPQHPETPTKFDRRREATRSELLTLGLERFPLKGYAATTIEDIVRDSGLTRGAFYFHFAGKEEFFLAVLRHRVGIRDNWWRVAEDPAHATLADAVRAAMEVLAVQADGGTAQWLALVVEFVQSVQRDEEYAAQLADLYAHWIPELRRFIAALDERGLIRRDRSHDELASDVFAHVEGVELHHRLYGAPIAGVVDSVCRLLAP